MLIEIVHNILKCYMTKATIIYNQNSMNKWHMSKLHDMAKRI